ncbi:Malyl-CoA lyase [invertebrate metagenome]|uniref:Malyl-CoA lyase n=1 Tax=invertebrate metagenome TaxID=1711999 RepID=A0A484H6T0_9ZZZZ
MSFTSIEEAIPRLNRSELAIPGSNAKFIEKAPASAADVIFFDLEDSVAIDQKDQARLNVIQALNELDFSGKTVSIRINGLDTPFMYRDVINVVEQAGHRLDLIMIPKIGTAADVYALDMLVTQIETSKGIRQRIGFELLIETSLGMQNIHAIAGASRRNESMLLGTADFAASTKAQTTRIGGANPHYGILTDPAEDGRRTFHWGDMWHYALARMVIAARANGLRPVDGPFGDFRDEEGYLAATRRAASLGCEGKMVVHPSQIAVANTLFSPSDAEVAQARQILQAMAAAEEAGAGAVSLDGKMIDIASIRQAQVIVKKADRIAAGKE